MECRRRPCNCNEAGSEPSSPRKLLALPEGRLRLFVADPYEEEEGNEFATADERRHRQTANRCLWTVADVSSVLQADSIEGGSSPKEEEARKPRSIRICVEEAVNGS